MINLLLQMTWYNPIFMMVLIGAIWFVPGLIVRRISEDRIKKAKKEAQNRRIASLYPKEDRNESGDSNIN